MEKGVFCKTRAYRHRIRPLQIDKSFCLLSGAEESIISKSDRSPFPNTPDNQTTY